MRQGAAQRSPDERFVRGERRVDQTGRGAHQVVGTRSGQVNGVFGATVGEHDPTQRAARFRARSTIVDGDVERPFEGSRF